MLVSIERACHKKHTDKYESATTYKSNVKANVKVFEK